MKKIVKVSMIVYINKSFSEDNDELKKLLLKKIGYEGGHFKDSIEENTKSLSIETFNSICLRLRPDTHLFLTHIESLSKSNERQLFYIQEFLYRGAIIYSLLENREFRKESDLEYITYSLSLLRDISRNSNNKGEAGRPKGSLSKSTKLSPHKLDIMEYRKKDIGYSAIGRILGVSRHTVKSFCEREDIL